MLPDICWGNHKAFLSNNTHWIAEQLVWLETMSEGAAIMEIQSLLDFQQFFEEHNFLNRFSAKHSKSIAENELKNYLTASEYIWYDYVGLIWVHFQAHF